MAEREADLPRKIVQVFYEGKARYRVAWGGRGGAKSWGAARMLLIKAAQRRMRVLCAREIQKSIADSVHALLKDQIEQLGLASKFRVQNTAIIGTNGSEFIFSGIRSNPDEIKSKEGIDILWVEEAQSVSKKSWNILTPTIRRPGSEIWVTFNPDLETDPTYQKFVVHPPPNAIVKKIGWEDNPWLPKELADEKDYDYANDPEMAAHKWGGETRSNQKAQILAGKYVVESFEPGDDWDGPYHGVDWGFSQDPAVMVKLWIYDRTLYVEHEAWGVGIENDYLGKLFERVPGARKYVIRADNARPETISHVRKTRVVDGQLILGYPQMTSCKKWEGSVKDGIEHLRSYRKIVIHPRCRHFEEEARLYSYKVDRLTGDVLPEIVDKHNHCMDAARYALEPIIRNKTLDTPTLDISVGAAPSHWRQLQ